MYSNILTLLAPAAAANISKIFWLIQALSQLSDWAKKKRSIFRCPKHLFFHPVFTNMKRERKKGARFVGGEKILFYQWSSEEKKKNRYRREKTDEIIQK